MNVFLDDERDNLMVQQRLADEGLVHIDTADWHRCLWPEEVIEFLQTGKVEWLSLDHDLGDTFASMQEKRPERTGMTVLNWLEEQVVTGKWKFTLPIILVHSMNPTGAKAMRFVAGRIVAKDRENRATRE